ncbi:MAG: DNA recombination protein RmuC [Helicobacteraceae bacterium]|jgi:DNA recombination protein RmuC|nr:DNA recombination protein RmuC [Helicobacteraceae bacterium]
METTNLLILLIAAAIAIGALNIAIFLIFRPKENFTRLETLIESANRASREEFGENRAELAKNFEIYNERQNLASDRFRAAIKEELREIREESAKKIEGMQKIIDEKLQSSIEKKFNESFNLIGERLEKVHIGLGEMQKLAQDVGGLKQALTNVKTRGAFGEIQLSAILEQLLSREQYYEQHAIAGGAARVDFAIRLPGNNDGEVLLPIDSKFPIEDFYRLSEAYESGADAAAIEKLRADLERSVKVAAKSIRDKYVQPPATTDFAVMFLPSEALYAEVLRSRGLVVELQEKFKISVAGPANIAAFLNSLRMGFKTLAIEKRSGEVWSLLGEVKAEFGRFGEAIDRVKKKLGEASGAIDDAGVRTRAIERRLRGIESLDNAKNDTIGV